MCSPLHRVACGLIALVLVAVCLLQGQRVIDALEPTGTGSQETLQGTQNDQEETAGVPEQWSWGQVPTLDESRELFEIEESDELAGLGQSQKLLEQGVLERLRQSGRFPVFANLAEDHKVVKLRRLLSLRNVREEAARNFTPEDEAYLTERLPNLAECLNVKRERAAATTGALESVRFAAYEFEIYLDFLAARMRGYEQDSAQLVKKLRKPLGLSFQAEILGQRFRDSQDERERAAVKEQVRTVLKETFDLFTECREFETELAETELEEAKTLLERARTSGGGGAEMAGREAAVARVEAGIRVSMNLLDERRAYRDVIIEHYLLVLLYSDVLGENFMW